MIFASACVVTTTDNGKGGNGGAGGDKTTSSSSGDTTSSSNVSSGGGAGGSMCTESCADAITNGLDVCASDATSLGYYDTLGTCLCDAKNCETDCKDNMCAGMTPSDACNTCVTKANQAGGGCENEYKACANDI